MELSLTSFEEALKKELDERAKTDELFAVSYAKPNKSLEECCKYIYQKAEEANKKKQRVLGCTKEQVVCLAIHYYDEDDIVVNGPKNKVVGGTSSPETTDLTISPEQIASEEKRKQRKPRKPKAAVDPNIPEPLDIPIF